MRLDVGPVTPAGVTAWMEWANEALREFDTGPALAAPPPGGGLVEAVTCLRRWMPCSVGVPATSRWLVEVDPDELEYLVHAFANLDTELLNEGRVGGAAASPEARTFYLVLVRALLHALETESPSRAAFVDQLRSSWPMAAAAN